MIPPIFDNYQNREPPDWGMAMDTAMKVLLAQPQREFPLKLAPIISQYPDLHLMTYEHFARLNHISLTDVIELVGSEDGALWYSDNAKTYLLLFNDKITTENRIRWTLAHELGHYFLRHNLEYNAPILGRTSLTEGEYKAYEQEANYFAKRLLAPYQIVVAIWEAWGRITSNELSYLFGISTESAEYYIKELQHRAEGGSVYTDGKLIDDFFDYINTIGHISMCLSCFATFDGEKHMTCPSCGNASIWNLGEKNFLAGMLRSPLARPLELLVLD